MMMARLTMMMAVVASNSISTTAAGSDSEEPTGDVNDVDEQQEQAVATPPGPVLLTLLGLVIVFLTFGLGATLDKQTVHTTLQNKLPPCLGLVCQYGIMPAVAYGLGQAFQFSPAKSMGLLLCGVVPGGSTSNLFTYYVDGPVGLSIFMTITSVLLAIGMVPFLLWAYGTPILSSSNSGNNDDDDDTPSFGRIPYGKLVITLALVFFPTLGGIYLRSKSEFWAKRAELVGTIIGALFIIVAMITAIIDNLDLFGSDASTWIASALLSVIGFVASFMISLFIFRLNYKTSLTIGLEVGIQNTILAITMTFVLFGGAETSLLNEALIFPLMCSLWDVANSILVTIIVLLARRRRKKQRQEEDNPNDDDDDDASEVKRTTRSNDAELEELESTSFSSSLPKEDETTENDQPSEDGGGRKNNNEILIVDTAAAATSTTVPRHDDGA